MGLIALAAEAAVPTKVIGISANGWITALVGLIASVIGTGGVYGIFKGLALLHEQRNNRARDQEDAATVVRREMMEFNEKLQTRIDRLEETGREDRRRFDEEMARLRSTHAEEVINIRNGYEGEIRELREEIVGLRRQMAQWQSTSGAAMSLAPHAPTTNASRIKNTGIDAALKAAFEVPGAGDDDAG